jgi:transcriptional regulator GlxA family with amidase domain
VEAVRLEAACRLLETTSGAIEQIARRCGFGTPETMNRAFRRRLGTTPGEHRRHFGAPDRRAEERPGPSPQPVG